jgi:hypothetical protein
MPKAIARLKAISYTVRCLEFASSFVARSVATKVLSEVCHGHTAVSSV